MLPYSIMVFRSYYTEELPKCNYCGFIGRSGRICEGGILAVPDGS